MTKLNTLTSLFLALSLATSPVAMTSCSIFHPEALPTLSASATDNVILRAEQTAETAKLTFTTFVRLERANEAALKKANPAIHEYADFIRLHGLDMIVALRSATVSFEENRSPENQATLNTVLMTLTSIVSQTNKYISESKGK